MVGMNIPYKDIEKKRKYQREWSKRKNAGLPTRTTPIPSREESKRKELERERRYRLHKRKIIEDVFGKKCIFCGHEKVMIIHRKDGKKHKIFSEMGLKELYSEIAEHKNEYVRVCGVCHKAVHWIMKWFGMTWEKIILIGDFDGEN